LIDSGIKISCNEEAFPEEERTENLDQILLEGEGAGILNWALDGIQKLKERKYIFSTSERAKEDTHGARRESNTVYSFIESMLAITNDESDTLTTRQMYGARGNRENASCGYIAFCEGNNVRPVSYEKFSREISRYADESLNGVSKTRNNGGERGYSHLKWIGSEEPKVDEVDLANW